MSETPRRVYLLRAKDLSPETIAVAFAKTSRSPEPFDQTAAELSESKSAQFHEKWVVGYGHSSVAEHAVLHIAAENVSRLAIECIESNRLASFTEKSTRYQKWSSGAYVVPPEVAGSAVEETYRGHFVGGSNMFSAWSARRELIDRNLEYALIHGTGASSAQYGGAVVLRRGVI